MYNLPARILHRLALGNKAVLETGFDIERGLFSRESPASTGAKHVFVSGLARAGTTALLRALYGSGEFASLTYRDMPFVLAPNIWARIGRGSRHRPAERERAHGDGIRIGIHSPEALEEVFWRVFGGDYIRQDRLVSIQPSDAAIAAFRAYVGLVNRRYGKQRYLSKNNNNILRLTGLARAFPNAVILIPFRDPGEQARSLLTQHHRFLARHRSDRFAQKYMTWLAHHEFGGDHRPFEWGVAARAKHTPTEPEYWLAQWIGLYGFLLERIPEDDERYLFVGYELLCGRSSEVWGNLCARLDIPPGTGPAAGFENRNRATRNPAASQLREESDGHGADWELRATKNPAASQLREEAAAIYQALTARTARQLLS
ncbi:MAG: sulfotransferase [Candidatus Thiosymbion ectosymbiont of Robbea hypermnestra]|nr:sulfotransferase [Candidatus Thiosymbion ectosymbiont of Robbea hypermnestra]